MDVVYICRAGLNNSIELRYSLRSIEKNFPHEKVFIIGEKPNWVTNVIHVKVIDRSKDVFYNTEHKVYKATLQENLSEEFFVFHDDFIIKKPIKDFKRLHKRPLKETLKTRAKGTYWIALKKIEKIFPDGLDYELHYPYFFNKSNLKKLFIKYPLTTSHNINSLYCNEFKVDSIKSQDCKVRNIENLKESLKKESLFLSTSDNLALDKAFEKTMNTIFPNKSKYEIK